MLFCFKAKKYKKRLLELGKGREKCRKWENREKWHKNAEENLSNLHKRLELYSEF